MRIKSEQLNIEIRTITTEDLIEIWNLAYKDNSEWMNYDGPYFEDPIYEKGDFINNIGPKYYVFKDYRFAIIKDNKIVGIVNAYFEDGKLKKWLEIGLVIYDSSNWGKGIGYQSLRLFTTYLFNIFNDIRRIGFTTWSGNYGMIKLGEKLGFTREAQIRQVRYWQNKYWDSIKFGVLREEWDTLKYQIES